MQSKIGNALSGARVRGEYDGKILADLKQRLENTLQNYPVVDIARTMQGDQGISPGIALGKALGKPVLVLTLRRGQQPQEGTHQHVPDLRPPFGRNSFFRKIEGSVLGR